MKMKVEKTFHDNLTRQITESVHIFRTEQLTEVSQTYKYFILLFFTPSVEGGRGLVNDAIFTFLNQNNSG